MERLGDDEISSIFERISNHEDKDSFALVCKKFLKVASFHLRRLHNKLPDLLYDMLIASPKMVSFSCHEPLSNNHMILIANSCPNIWNLTLSVKHNLDPEVGKLDFNDAGLHAVAETCVHLFHVNLSGRLRFKELGIGSLVRSCKNLRRLNLTDCVNVTDKSLKIIAEATCLNELQLLGCYLISDLGLEYLANGDLKYCLVTLDLSRCDRITDNGVIHLKKLVTLISLSFLRCGGKITDCGIVALCELPNIKSLNLDYLFNITDVSLLEIGRKYLNIVSISLDGCKRITGVGLRAFTGHRYLFGLRLFSCYKISWEDVLSIALTLPSLSSIRLSRRIKKPMPEAGYECFHLHGNYLQIEWK
ncbi:Leucine-rich repeat, cysteine-containing subtype [Artemisia annua]|uniref:Leucine-rich repeat, cysteine-containing subtype n=1 Tax=Artemisia annua TaxID=35608 RepID=A0A2U1PKT6_ARTAN|nr:Leucine-rich repeat, cysteine-containing subtype [Artemisia annua]